MSSFTVHEKARYLAIDFYSPASRNAFSLDAARELADLVKEHRNWRKAVVVSASRSPHFCSGGNLTDYKKLKTKTQGLKVNREIGRHLNSFAKWPVVKLAVIEGDVLGGGVEWLGHFDYRWCTPSVLMSFWQRRIGLSTGWGGGRYWAERIGEDQVRSLLLEATLLSSQRALSLGLVDRIVTRWKMEHEVEAWTSRMSGVAVKKILGWTAKRESTIFNSLWMASEHSEVLKRWNK